MCVEVNGAQTVVKSFEVLYKSFTILSLLQVKCSSVALRPRTRSFPMDLPPFVTSMIRVVPLKTILWTLMAPLGVLQGWSPGTADTWPWCPTLSAAPWAGSGPGLRGPSGLPSHLHPGCACSRTQSPGAAAQIKVLALHHPRVVQCASFTSCTFLMVVKPEFGISVLLLTCSWFWHA